jgi:hypothetical protein
MNPTALGLGQRPTNKKSQKNIIQFIYFFWFLDDHVTDLIDLSSPDTHRTDMSVSVIGEKISIDITFRAVFFLIVRYPQSIEFSVELKLEYFIIETQRQQLSHIPSLQQILTTATGSLNEQENQVTSREYDDPLVHHVLRYSELMSNNLESKPITEKMDHWYLDLKKNLMVKNNL